MPVNPFGVARRDTLEIMADKPDLPIRCPHPHMPRGRLVDFDQVGQSTEFEGVQYYCCNIVGNVDRPTKYHKRGTHAHSYDEATHTLTINVDWSVDVTEIKEIEKVAHRNRACDLLCRAILAADDPADMWARITQLKTKLAQGIADGVVILESTPDMVENIKAMIAQRNAHWGT